MTKKNTSYQEDLIESLKDTLEAAVYLNEAIEDGDKEVFLLAMRNVALKRTAECLRSQKKRT